MPRASHSAATPSRPTPRLPTTPAWLALGLLWSGGLACGGLSEVPARGGPQWLRVEGKSFTLYTDQERSQAIASLQELEHLLAAFLQLGWEAQGTPEGRLHVAMFASEAHFRELAGPDIDGYYRGEVLLDPWVVTYADSRPRRLAVLKHQLSHHIAYLAIGDQPAWFAEGIATFFETAYFDRSGRFVVGAVPRDMAEVLKRRRMPAARLLSPQLDPPTPVFNATSWLLVHYLMMQHADAFAQYQRALAAGADPPIAWAAAFGSLTPGELDRRLGAYATDGVFEGTRRPVVLPSVLLRVERMDDADVLALRAQLWLTCHDCGDAASRQRRARRELDGALRADPDHVRANGLALTHLRESPTQRLPDSEHLTQAHPDAALAWLLRARALRREGKPPEAVRAAARRALALKPEHPVVMMTAALAAIPAAPARALELSREALRKRPAHGELLRDRGAVLSATGHCRELAELRVRARHLPHRPADLLRALDALARDCRAPPPPPAGPAPAAPDADPRAGDAGPDAGRQGSPGAGPDAGSPRAQAQGTDSPP